MILHITVDRLPARTASKLKILLVVMGALLINSCASSDDGTSADAVPAAQDGVSAQVAEADTLRNCGNEFEGSCGPAQTDFWNASCDTGLRREVNRCGCLLHGPFGGCLIPQFCGTCVNETRRRPSLNTFGGSWEAWALRNQRDNLAKDEPINWVMHLGTHNSFNSVSDGHIPIFGADINNVIDAPNHFYSMTDQLRTGARALAIDLHFVDDNARLCHGGYKNIPGPIDLQLCLNPQPVAPVFPSMRYYANGIKEIRNWLRDNPDQIIILDLENYVGGVCSGCFGDPLFGMTPLKTYLGDMIYPASGAEAPQDGIGFWPSRRDLLANGKRVIVIDSPVRDPVAFFERTEFSGGDFKEALGANEQAYYPTCNSTLTWTDGQGVEHFTGPKAALNGQFSAVVEDRTLLGPITQLGQLAPDDVAAAAQCNYSVLFMDFFSSLLPVLGRDLDLPDFTRQKAAIWSWKEGDRGQNGNCAKLEASSGRWVSADCSEEHHFTCGPARSESGTDPSQWRQFEEDWRVTAGAGPWTDGQATCTAEYPGHVFSVPVNGYQNTVLKDVQGTAGDLWLNYTDQQKDGAWEIPALEDLNTPPIADAGPDQDLECGTTVTLDGSGSVDADGDPLTYTWTGPFGTLTGPVVTTTLEAGTHAITLAVADGKGGTDTDTITITIGDATPPSLTVSLSPSILWPPNHKMVKVVAEVRTQDACGDDQVLVELQSIVSSEPEHVKVDPVHDKGFGGRGRDDAHDSKAEKGPDIQEADFGTGDLEFLLRAERSGKGPGRIYTVTYRATDLAGNTTVQSAEVRVPHDRKRGHRTDHRREANSASQK